MAKHTTDDATGIQRLPKTTTNEGPGLDRASGQTHVAIIGSGGGAFAAAIRAAEEGGGSP